MTPPKQKSKAHSFWDVYLYELRRRLAIPLLAFACILVGVFVLPELESWYRQNWQMPRACHQNYNTPRTISYPDTSLANAQVIGIENIKQLQLAIKDAEIPLQEPSTWHPSGDYVIVRNETPDLYTLFACTGTGVPLKFLGYDWRNDGEPEVAYTANAPRNVMLIYDIRILNEVHDDVREESRLPHIGHTEKITGTVGFHPDGRLLALGLRESKVSGMEYAILFYDLAQNRVVYRIPYVSEITDLQFNADGTLLGINNAEWWGIPDA